MPAPRPDRIVRLLTALASITYVAMWIGAGVVLTAAPAIKLFDGANPDWWWGLPVPAAVLDAEATVRTSWGAGRLEIEDVRGVLRLPIALMPWWLFGLVWTHAAVAGALMLSFLYHLRRLFQRVRDGAPFDAQNAIRLRRIGLLLFTLAVVNGVAGLVTSLAVRRGLPSGEVDVPAGLQFDAPLVLVALVLIALAEIFRRGAELEREQSLVV